MERHRFQAHQIINFDEKGFLIGRQRATKRYFSKNTKKVGVKQDGSREWISIKGAITAAGEALSPAIIYQSQAGHVREDWIRDWNPGGGFRAAVTSTPSGWTNADLALQFLEQIIDKETRKEGGGWRLLLLDGHSTHTTLPFLEYCDSVRLIPAFLPAHSTHLMQPLDVGCFGPLSQAYSKELEEKLSSLPLAAAITKGDFWRLMEVSWKASLTEKNIVSAFAACGIYPYAPKKVLGKIPPPITVESSESSNSSQQARLFRRETRLLQEKLDPRFQQLRNDFERLTVELECTKHEISQLQATIARQKKKAANSKQILHPNLPNLGKGMFLTPGKIQRAREWEQEKVDKAEAEATAKAAKKYQSQLAAANKKAEIASRKAEALEKQQNKAQDKQREAQEREKRKVEEAAGRAANQQLREEVRFARRVSKTPGRLPKRVILNIQTTSKVTCQTPKEQEEEWVDIDEAAVVTNRGRNVRKPSRFRQ